jgi:hypothetical protein
MTSISITMSMMVSGKDQDNGPVPNAIMDSRLVSPPENKLGLKHKTSSVEVLGKINCSFKNAV